jgi:hypothetical protein
MILWCWLYMEVGGDLWGWYWAMSDAHAYWEDLPILAQYGERTPERHSVILDAYYEYTV